MDLWHCGCLMLFLILWQRVCVLAHCTAWSVEVVLKMVYEKLYLLNKSFSSSWVCFNYVFVRGKYSRVMQGFLLHVRAPTWVWRAPCCLLWLEKSTSKVWVGGGDPSSTSSQWSQPSGLLSDELHHRLHSSLSNSRWHWASIWLTSLSPHNIYSSLISLLHVSGYLPAPNLSTGLSFWLLPVVLWTLQGRKGLKF